MAAIGINKQTTNYKLQRPPSNSLNRKKKIRSFLHMSNMVWYVIPFLSILIHCCHSFACHYADRNYINEDNSYSYLPFFLWAGSCSHLKFNRYIHLIIPCSCNISVSCPDWYNSAVSDPPPILVPLIKTFGTVLLPVKLFKAS